MSQEQLYFIIIILKNYYSIKMNDFPLVSIVITTYNSSTTIVETLNSLISQTYNKFEVLIFDDCSKDNTVQISSEFLSNNRVEYLIFTSKINTGGPATGRNWGIMNSKGKYICFLDADDVWVNEKLEKQIKIIEDKNLDVVSSNAIVLNGNQFPVYFGFLNIWIQILRNSIILSSSIVKRDTIISDKISFNESKRYISVEDYDFFLKILLQKKNIYVMKEKLIFYRIVDNSISHIDFKRNERKRLMVLDKLETDNLLIKAFSKIIRIVYNTKLSLWNSRY
jgi:glycosyltransferase involved in cell wall biosynthesis